jgi:hypothetical protein
MYNGTVLFFEKGKTITDLDADYLNLWPLVIDANGYEPKNGKPEIHFYSRTENGKFFYEPVTLKQSLTYPVKKYEEVHRTIRADDREKYFSTFKRSLGLEA